MQCLTPTTFCLANHEFIKDLCNIQIMILKLSAIDTAHVI